MHHGKPLFNDARVRKAVVLATEREKMIEMATEGWGVLGGYIGPHTPYGLPLRRVDIIYAFLDPRIRYA